ncbi:MAG: PqqD family protein [Proteobacteria bacterium]|nr:PqqD family protein [Pseudomonadota bacterium]
MAIHSTSISAEHYRAAATQVSRRLGDETVLLDLAGSVYYSLNDVGSLVWEQLQTAHTLAELCEVVQARFDVEAAACEADLRQLLNELLERGLVETLEGPIP